MAGTYSTPNSFAILSSSHTRAMELWYAAIAFLVRRPCLYFPFLSPLGAPPRPPCSWQRRLVFNAGFKQAVPRRVLAPHRLPGQFGPNCQ